MSSKVEEFFAHYASEFYDPAKAHEYYLRNRKLKNGARSVKGLTSTQKEALAYTNNNIRTARKGETDKATSAQKSRVDTLRKNAETAQNNIKSKLDALMASLQAKADSPPATPPPKPQPLNVIPSTASPKVKAYLTRQNAQLTRANATAAKEWANKQAANDSSNKKAAITARQAASVEMQRVGTELKASVTKARASYEASKKQIAAKYDKAFTTEYNNISTKVR